MIRPSGSLHPINPQSRNKIGVVTDKRVDLPGSGNISRKGMAMPLLVARLCGSGSI